MIAGLAACREDQVMAQDIAAAEAVVVVHAGPGPVEEDVARNGALRSLGLHIEAALLLVETDLAHHVPQDRVIPRVVPVRAIDPRLREVCPGCVVREARVRRLVRVAPRNNGIASDVGEVVGLDGCVPIVARNHDRVPIQTLKDRVLNLEALRTLQEHCGDAVERPIAGGGDAVGFHVRVPRRLEGYAVDHDAAHGVPLCARGIDKYREPRHDDFQVLWGSTSAVVEQVQVSSSLVEVELARVVELLENVFDEEVTAGILASCTLVAPAAKSEVVGLTVVVAHLEHPIGPPGRPPYIENCPADILVRRIRQCARLRHNA
mmetsp:Transcript_111348/g.287901  ORF Transcript_111348/g.287901 Transcript_111348/m.287901 type:complete len:319 (-) Transcript_111348:446-1402(-)